MEYLLALFAGYFLFWVGQFLSNKIDVNNHQEKEKKTQHQSNSAKDRFTIKGEDVLVNLDSSLRTRGE